MAACDRYWYSVVIFNAAKRARRSLRKLRPLVVRGGGGDLPLLQKKSEAGLDSRGSIGGHAMQRANCVAGECLGASKAVNPTIRRFAKGKQGDGAGTGRIACPSSSQ
jgi:hypothetical protein